MNKLLKNKAKGFTLIELMIVVAIIGILAAIAIPNFIRYQLRSKTAEARTNVRSIKTSQESFRATEDSYAPVGLNGNVGPNSVKSTWTDTACPAGCGRGPVGMALCTQYDCIGFQPDGPVYYEYESVPAVVGAIPEFCVGARGDLDGDAIFGGYEWQSTHGLGVTVGVIDCPAQAAGLCGAALANDSEMVDCSVGIY